MRLRGPDLWRWVGDALLAGAIPNDATPLRRDTLCAVLELPLAASDDEVLTELALFKRHGRQRG